MLFIQYINWFTNLKYKPQDAWGSAELNNEKKGIYKKT